MPGVVAYPFTLRNGSHQQLCVIGLSYIFYIFQLWNLLEKGFFADVFIDQKDLYETIFFKQKLKKIWNFF